MNYANTVLFTHQLTLYTTMNDGMMNSNGNNKCSITKKKKQNKTREEEEEEQIRQTGT